MTQGLLLADATSFENTELVKHQQYQASMNEIIPFSFIVVSIDMTLIYILLLTNSICYMCFISDNYTFKITLAKIK